MGLSKKAHDIATSEAGNLLWDVTANLWDPETNPSGYVSLGMAENELMQDEMVQQIQKKFSMSQKALTYGDGTTGSGRLKLVLSSLVNRHFNPHHQVNSSDITITNGCSAAIEHLAWALSEAGDGFLVGKPFFRAFVPTLGLRVNARVIQVPAHGIDPLGSDIISEYEATLLRSRAEGQNIAGILLCNPHNPLGRCYSREAIIGIMMLCQKYSLHLISDEVYALSVWSHANSADSRSTPFTSCLSIDTTDIMDASYLHVVWGVSKDFGSNGIRLGAIISHCRSLHKALVPAALYSMSSALADDTFASVLEDREWVDEYLAENRRRLSHHHDFMVKWANRNNIPYAQGSNAGFFLWVNLGEAYHKTQPQLPRDGIEDRLMNILMEKRIFAARGTDFGAEEEGWFRLVFSIKKDVLEEGLRRILSAINAQYI